jgi:hypothetical protein
LLSHLEKWEFYGIKSPFWWIFHAATFATKIAALASVVSLFCSKQSLMLKNTAEAAWFLLTHDEPEAEPEKPTDAKAEPSTGVALSEPLLGKEQAEKSLEASKENPEAAKEQAEKALEAGKEKAEAAKEQAEKALEAAREKADAAKEQANALAKGDLSAVANLIPQPSEWIIDLNEKFWIIVGMTVNIVMSFGLVLCMYVKVATFTGDMSDIAIVTVALYFVSDLDEKVLEANPKMKKTYAKMVLAQTERNDANPIWIKKVIGIAVHTLEASVPIGIAFICLFAWKGLDAHGQDLVIGGDPFAPVKSV